MKYFYLLICIICTGCVTTVTTAPAGQEEIAAAKAELLACGRSVLPEIDDGVSPANVVAAAIPSLCQIETSKMISLVTQGTKDLYVIDKVTQHAQSGKSFIPVVLQYRAFQKS